MKDDAANQSWRFGWALPVSFGLHVLIAVLLMFELPASLPQPQEEQPVEVELVPPPTPPEEVPPEPPPPAAEEPEKSDTPQPEPPPDMGDEEARREAAPALSPVFRFGEKDAGPRESPDGNSGEDGLGTSPSDSVEEAVTVPPSEQPAEAREQVPPAETSETDDPKPAEVEDGDSTALASAPPEALLSQDAQASPEQSASVEAEEQISLPMTAETPMPRPARSAQAPSAPTLPAAKRLFSHSTTGDQTATSATGSLPREVRGGRLCVTELREQLRNAPAPYFPDLLPSYPLKDGTVLEVSDAAFRVRGQWFNLSFRCDVDADATRVVSFAFRVGEPIPPGQWAGRGLPSR